MIDVYVVLVQDRHADPDIKVFADAIDAIEYADRELKTGSRHCPENIEVYELTQSMLDDGWIFFATYSCEGDSVRVTKHQVSS
jgi:hypothetical protein